MNEVETMLNTEQEATDKCERARPPRETADVVCERYYVKARGESKWHEPTVDYMELEKVK